MKYKLIYLEWEDALSVSGWKYESDVLNWANKAQCTVKQCGWVIEENKHFIILASRIHEWNDEAENEMGNLQKIPTTWIRKRRVIKI